VQICDAPGAAPCPSFGVVSGTIAEAPYYAASAEIDPLEPPFIPTPNGERFIGVFAVEALGGLPPPGPVSNSIRIRLRNLVVAGDYTVTTPVGQFVLTAIADANGAIQDINFIFPVPGELSTVGEGLTTDVPPFSGALAGPVQLFLSNGTGPAGFFGDGVTPARLPGVLNTVAAGAQNIFRIVGPAGSGIDVNTADFVVEGKAFVLAPPQQTIATFTRDAAGAGSVDVKAIGVAGATTVDVVGSDNIGNSVPLPGEPVTGFPMAAAVNPPAGEPGSWTTASGPPAQIPIVGADTLPGFVMVALDRQPVSVPPPAPLVPQTAQQIAALTDAVTISEAAFDAPTGVLTITASSSDQFADPALPVLTVASPGPPAVLLGEINGSGTITVNNPSPVPTTVNATSSGGGRASLDVAGIPAPDPGAGLTPTPTPAPAVGGGGGGGGCFIDALTSAQVARTNSRHGE
jgi:hypothetical protein